MDSRPNAKPADVEGLVLRCLNVKAREELPEFPSNIKFKNMFTSLKKKKGEVANMEVTDGEATDGRMMTKGGDGIDLGTIKWHRRGSSPFKMFSQ